MGAAEVFLSSFRWAVDFAPAEDGVAADSVAVAEVSVGSAEAEDSLEEEAARHGELAYSLRKTLR